MQAIFRRFITILLLAIPLIAAAEASQVRFDDIRVELEASVAELGHIITRLETLQAVMERSATANRNYDEQKNIFLSSMLANATIIAVCQYEADQLTLFLDLREKNRLKYYDIRIESLETSIHQIRNMDRQIRINYSIFPAHFFKPSIVQKEQKTLAAALSALQNCIDLLRSVQKK